MGKISNKAEQPDQYWQQFVADGLVEKGLKPDDFLVPESSPTEYSDQFPKQALKSLKIVLTPDAHRKLSGRWRKYKYSATHNNTTLTIRKETLHKLQAMAKKTGLQDDNYDLMLDYLLDPNEDLEPAKIEVEKLGLESGLDFETRSEKLRVKLRFRGSSWRHILATFEYAFKSGWLACQATHAKRRTDKIMEESANDFVEKLKGF
tara:strand:- start:1088 stop:1702 length:615 start_codon:yes stop_codon:yes gene_type:complete